VARICLLEPYYTGSHRAWVDGYAAHSRHEVVPLTLSGQFWKWRMHGGAVTLARYYREQANASERQADLFLATDMLDLTTFLALTRDLTQRVPVALYMHENQLTYPSRPGEKRDLHYGFINYASMLCAERIFFNSQFHLESWFDELPRLLKHFPDYNELPSIVSLHARSAVLPLGLDLARFDAHRPQRPTEGPAIILWNHRWEYDKNPGEFLQALYTLADQGLDFRVVFLGEVFVRVPPEFQAARERLGARILQFGYVESFADYARWLWQADIVVSTALHDFFGAAVVEAMYCGCRPILPWRLAYPQFVPEAYRARCLYHDHEELVALLQRALADLAEIRGAHSPRPQPFILERGTGEGGAGPPPSALQAVVTGYDWSVMAPLYDAQINDLLTRGAH
jgi:glycosyltransferase involved in cell wall biosynthesis